jgi:hypothetical protein
MQEGNEFAARAFDRAFIDEPAPRVCGPGQLAGDVAGGKSDVMDSAAWMFFEKFCDGAVRRCRFQQFEMSFPHAEKSGADFLPGNLLDFFALEAEGLFVMGYSFGQGRNGDAQMVDPFQHVSLSVGHPAPGKDMLGQAK